MHSAEFYRGALHSAKNSDEPVPVAHYTKLLAEAESHEAGERSKTQIKLAVEEECLRNAALFIRLSGFRNAECFSDLLESEADKVLALLEQQQPREAAQPSLADQLAAAKAEARGLRLLADLWKNNAQKYREWVGRALDKQKEYLDLAQYFSGEDPARDARMKALGAAEYLEAAAEKRWTLTYLVMREEAAQLRQQAEAKRLAEGE